MRDKFTVYKCNAGRGNTMFTCFNNDIIFPIGFVIGNIYGKGNSGKTRMEVFQSFVTPWARKQGIRSFINHCIFNDFDVDVICTQNGSEEGGESFMKSVGYTLDEESGIWYITKEKFNAYWNKKYEQ